jgi:hypothetical protein
VRITDIKWNWERMRYATVITDLVRIGTSPRFELHVQPAQIPWFLKGDIVFIRKHQRGKVIKSAPAVRSETSAPYIVEQVSQAGDNVVVAPTMPNTDLAGFTAGSLLYMPVPSVSPGHYLRMVSPAAERIMQIAIKGTMTGTTCDAAKQLGDNGSYTQVPEKTDPVGRVSAKNLPGLVGVYFGGARRACGILHPTGHCMMRNTYSESERFCPICRYILVDYIDPTQHFRIDYDYAKEYPT